MSRSRAYTFTAWADKLAAPLESVDWDLSVVKYVVFQLEACPSTGRHHYQGYFFFADRNGYGMKTAFRLLPQLCGAAATHLEVAKGTPEDNQAYCTEDVKKGVPRVSGPWEFGQLPAPSGPVAKHTLEQAIAALEESGNDVDILARGYPVLYAKFFRQIEALAARAIVKPEVDFSAPRPWQQDVVDLVKTDPDNRSVNWYVDAEGGQGKTYLSKHLIAEYGAFYTTGGKAADILHAYNHQRVIIFDFTRDKDGFVCYSVIEQMKNGLMFSGKYNSMTKIRPHNAHVIVFSNFEPDQTKLSRDRWRITRLHPAPPQDPVALALLGV